MKTGTTRTLLMVTALVETPLGLALLVVPTVPFDLLFGVRHPALDVVFIGRIAGAALLPIGIAAWCARSDPGTPAQLGLLAGLLAYHVTVGALLAFAESIGVGLYQSVVLHALLGIGCLVALIGVRFGGVFDFNASAGEIEEVK